MSKSSGYLSISATVFAIVAIAHLVRALQQWPIVIGSWSVPVDLSWIAAAGAAALSAWALTLLRERA